MATGAPLGTIAGALITGNVLGLEINTTATSNLGLGTGAVDSITTGDYNVGVGDNALTACISGSNNTANGYQALFSNTTGYDNTAVGHLALFTMTTGYRNVAIGKDAMRTSVAGVYSVAIGYEALKTANAGSETVAIGAWASKNTTTGGANVSIGYTAGQGITTGINNVCLGSMAGVYNAAIGRGATLTTGSNNVLIGKGVLPVGAGDTGAHGLGYDMECAAGYTTLGYNANDIRAAHGTASWATVSDRRYKKDIVASTVGLSFVNALQPRTFKYKTLGELPTTFHAYKADSTEVFKNSNTNHGFIAQEVKAAIDADSSIKDGFRMWDDREDGSQEVAEAALIPVLVKAIQELSSKIDSQQLEINTLKGA